MNLRLTNETACDYTFEDLVDGMHLSGGDLRFTHEQLDRMDNQVLRRLAAAVESDEVSGRSTKLEIKSFFAVQKTLSDSYE